MGPRQAIYNLDDDRCRARLNQCYRAQEATRVMLTDRIQPSERLIAATFTLERHARGVRLDEIEAKKALRMFLRMINQRVFRNGFHRKGLRINVCPALEGIGSEHLHFHCIFETPDRWSVEEYKQLLENTWTQRLDFGADEVLIESNIDHGWTDYITKYANIEGEIEWDQFHWV